MKKQSIKKVVMGVMLGIMLMACTACGRKGVCEMCGKETTVTKVTYEGESADLCKDCKKIFDAAMALGLGN